ncbi:MAG: Zn-ribbon domain-containing OB-fold protein [Chloroflexi bacterium]|nr:Zn-ribbon domain-containing OB-fold protein [Chloroflexota bacterium]
MTQQAPRPQKPIPVSDALTAPFWEGTKAGELRIQRCLACNTKFFYPRERCPECLSDRLIWHKTTGKGRIYSFIIVRQPGNPAFNDDVPYIYALVQLDEGVRMNGNVTGIPVENVEIDMEVQVYFDKMSEDIYLPQWKPA